MMLSTYYFIALLAASSSVVALPATANTTNIALEPPQQILNQTHQTSNDKDKLRNHSKDLPHCYAKCVESVGIGNVSVQAFCDYRMQPFDKCINRRGHCVPKNLIINWFIRERDWRNVNKQRERFVAKNCPEGGKGYPPHIGLSRN